LSNSADVLAAIQEVEDSNRYAGIQPVSFGLASDAIARSEKRSPSEAASIIRNAFRNGAHWAPLAANFYRMR